jgi:N-formylglutamate amidohydrolase
MESPAPFRLLNPDAEGPVVVSVSHAGRDYSGPWMSQLRTPVARIAALEDRFADALAIRLTDAPVLIAVRPRAYIDLNRHEAEIDPGLVEGAVASRLILSPKVRNGLGLVPRRLAGAGEVWRGRLSLAEVEQRIAAAHRPYHQCLTSLLRRTVDRHGVAVLLDLHSMPSLAATDDRPAAQVVIGNRFGQSAAAWVTTCAAEACDVFDLKWRENSPYAGGHIVERHGAPLRGIHALQVEIDRALYLDEAFDRPSPSTLIHMQAFIGQLVTRLSTGATDRALPLAAE